MKIKKLFAMMVCVALAVTMSIGAAACKSGGETPPAELTAPVVTGVVHNGTYYLGKDTIVPVYDKGEGTMIKDGGASYAFASGTAISELGDYVLTVTATEGEQSKTTTVSFAVKEYFPEYPGQITDLFDNTRLGDGYLIDSGTAVTVADGVATFANKPDGDPWSIVKRKFSKVNATANPYLEIKVDSISNGRGSRMEVVLSNTEYDTEAGSVGHVVLGEITYGGVYRYSVLDFINNATVPGTDEKPLSATEQDLYLILKVIGKTAGYAAAEIDYYKSVAELPATTPAAAYVDKTEATLAEWREDSVKYELAGGKMYAFVDPGHDEIYGRMVKRVALNTRAYPYLVVDVAEVAAGTSWNLKYSAAGVNGELSLTGDTAATGRYEIDLSRAEGIKDSEYVEVTLGFYVIGKGDDRIVSLNGLETLAESERAPALHEDFSSASAWTRGGSVQEVTLAVADGSGTLTLALDPDLNGDHYACINFTAALNTLEYRYLVVDVAAANAEHVMKYQGQALYAQGKTTGKIYIDLQNGAFGIPSGYHESVTFEFYLIGDHGQTVILQSLSNTNEAPDPNLIEDFARPDWVSGVGTNIVTGNTMKLVKPAGADMGKAEKSFAVDTTANPVVQIGVAAIESGWDAGFKIKISNRGVDKWPTLTIQGDTVTRIAREGGGWDLYIDLKALADAAESAEANLDATKFVGNVTLTFEIVLEFGDAEKTITFDYIRLTAAVPAL